MGQTASEPVAVQGEAELPLVVRRSPLRLILAHRLLILAAVGLASALVPWTFQSRNYLGNPHWPVDEPVSWRAAWKTWDAQHFLHLSQQGYRAGQVSNHFYPLWPLLVRIGGAALGGHDLLAALLLANAMSVAGLLLFHRYVSEAHGPVLADRSLLLLLAYPGTFYLALAYSEPLFFLLVMVFFLGLRRQRYWQAGLAALFLPMSRAVGAFIALPLCCYLYRQWRSGDRFRWRDCLWLLCPAAGVGIYMLLMYCWTGNPLEVFSVQRYYVPNASFWRLLRPGELLGRLVHLSPEMLISWLDRAAFVGLCASVMWIWRLDRVLLAYALVMGFVPSLTVGFTSFGRYVVMVFPVFMALAVVMPQEPPAMWKRLAVRTAIALQVVLAFAHACNCWVA